MSNLLQLVSFLLVIASSMSQRISVEVSPSQIVKAGSNVTITCRISPGQNADVVNYIQKVIVHEGQRDKFSTQRIATSNILDGPYRGLRKYSIAATTDGMDKLFKLHIDGVTNEDSGAYACSLPVYDNLYEVVRLDVYRPPDTVIFVNHSMSVLSEPIYLKEDVMTPFHCHVSNIVPVADISIHVGDRNRDITKDFLISTQQKLNCTDSLSNCPLHHSFDMHIENREFKPTFLDDDKQLTCQAKMRHYDKDVIKTSIKMDVKYAPRIPLCADKWNSTINSTDVLIKCRIMSNPPAQLKDKTWVIFPASNRSLLSPPEITIDFQVYEEEVGNKSSIIVLRIFKVRKEHIGKYELVVTNELGSATKHIELVDYKDIRITNGVGKIITGWVLFILSVLVITL